MMISVTSEMKNDSKVQGNSMDVVLVSILLLPALRYGRSPGSQFCKALLIPRRTAPTCPAFKEKKLNLEECFT